MIELLVIIVILGVLAATVMFALSGTTSSAAVAACNSDAKSVELAVEVFHDNPGNTAAFGQYPNASTATPSGNSQLTAPASSNYGGPYLRTWPSSSHYTITLGTSGRVYVNGNDYDAATNPCSSVSLAQSSSRGPGSSAAGRGRGQSQSPHGPSKPVP